MISGTIEEHIRLRNLYYHFLEIFNCGLSERDNRDSEIDVDNENDCENLDLSS